VKSANQRLTERSEALPSQQALALGPAADRWRLGVAGRSWLGGAGRFLRRRAWRILPAYWAALAFSLFVAYHVPASHKGEPTHRSIAVFGLLLQDTFWAKTPNGAFWTSSPSRTA